MTMEDRSSRAAPVRRFEVHNGHQAKDAKYYHQRSLALVANNRLGEAIEDLNRAVDLGWNDSTEFTQLGIYYYQQSRLNEAKVCLELADRINSSDPIAANCKGVILKAAGQIDSAVHEFNRALQMNPSLVEAHTNLGNVHRDAARFAEADQAYLRALSLDPNNAAAHNNLGVSQLIQRLLDAAEQSFKQAIVADDRHVEAYNNLGNVYRERGDWHQAEASYRSALEIHTHIPELHNNLGVTLHAMGRLNEAIEAFEIALQMKPDWPEVTINLSTALMDQQRLVEALHLLKNQVESKPAHVPSLLALGNGLRQLDRPQAARECFQCAASIEPDETLHQLRASICVPRAHSSHCRANAARDNLLNDISELKQRQLKFLIQDTVQAVPECPHAIVFLSGDLRPLREAYASIFTGHFAQPDLPTRHSRPQLGIVVTRKHEGIFIRSMANILRQLDFGAFDIKVFCAESGSRRLREGLDRSEIDVIPLPYQYDQAIQTLLGHRLDVAFYWEVGTDATNYFLPFTRIAPVQCTSWGVQTTSGISTMDYYISSRLIEPTDADSHYSEQLILLNSMLAMHVPQAAPKSTIGRDHFGIRSDEVLFACAQNVGKYHPDFDAMLGGVLRSVPNGRVVLTADESGHAGRVIVERMRASLPDVVDRILMLPRLDHAKYYSLLQEADVLLDPPHFSGANSTCDAIAMGKPVVALPSEYQRGRYTLGCLTKIGTPELIADSLEAYAGIANRLAEDSAYRSAIATRILDAQRELCGDTNVVSEYQQAFEQLIEYARNESRSQRKSPLAGTKNVTVALPATSVSFDPIGSPPDSPQTMAQKLRSADEASHAGLHREAVEIYESLLRDVPEHRIAKQNAAKTLNSWGNKLRQQKMLPESVAAFERALQLETQIPEIHRNYAISLLEIGSLNEAAAAVEIALKLRPEWPSAVELQSVIQGVRAYQVTKKQGKV